MRRGGGVGTFFFCSDIVLLFSERPTAALTSARTASVASSLSDLQACC
jgi:hypothetical protein